MVRIYFLACALLACFAVTAQTISIQGTLKDANGASVADGRQMVTFELYDALTGGTRVWREDAEVDVLGGIYSHQLGSVDAFDGSEFRGPRWLQLIVGGQALTPRAPMSYAPYALTVATAEAITPQGCSGQVGDLKYSILKPSQFQQFNGDCWVLMDGSSLPGNSPLRQFGFSSVPDMSGLFIRAQEVSGYDGDKTRTGGTPVATLKEGRLGSHTHGMDDGGAHSHTYKDSWLKTLEADDEQAYHDNLTLTHYAPKDVEGSFVLPRNGQMNINNARHSAWMRYENDGKMNDRWTLINTESSMTTSSAGTHKHTVQAAGDTETSPANKNFYLYMRVK